MLLRHFVMASFFKINVIVGQFLKNAGIYYEKTTKIEQTNKFKNDILFIKMHILKNVHVNQ